MSPQRSTGADSESGPTALGDEPPEVLDIEVGLPVGPHRTESDSMGDIEVPGDRYWGAQTERSLHHFDIGDDAEHMPIEVYRALAVVKRATATVNAAAGKMPEWMAALIERVCDEISAGLLDDHFPLYVWQTGSGTQTNMNLNEVISNRCIQLVGGALGSRSPVHPNDHVNMSQSSNDTFPTAMHIAADTLLNDRLLPSLEALTVEIEERSRRWADVVKIGRTHLQDATPLTVGQEWSGYAALMRDGIDALVTDSATVLQLASGGTAVGTGLNTWPGFDVEVAEEIATITGRPFVTAPNKFAALSSTDPLLRCSSGIRNVGVSLFKIANDLRWLGSGPRAGLHELVHPANEPGSSIMPGKVNPTQCEAMLMVCIQVMGNDATIAMAAKEGNLELNTFRPLIIANLLQSMRILADACDSFRVHLIDGLELDRESIQRDVDNSAMLVTALAPVVGYDEAARIAHLAVDEDLTLRDAAVQSGVDGDLFDRLVVPVDMTRPGPK